MQRITKANLVAVVDRINRTMGTPAEPYSKPDSIHDKWTFQPGNYHLDIANGGYQLEQNSPKGSGGIDTLCCGHVSARELYTLMHAWLRGVEAEQERVERERKVRQEAESGELDHMRSIIGLPPRDRSGDAK